MSSRRTLEQALPIIPWQQALRGLQASQTTSLWGMEGGDKKQAHVRACGKGGGKGVVPRFPPPRLCKVTWPTGETGRAELGSYGLCVRRPRP